MAVTLASQESSVPQEPFYVRCIKPNEDKVAAKLDEGHCRHQVAYLGLLENVRVRRAGFASRQPYPRFLLRYGGSLIPMVCVPMWSPRDKGNAGGPKNSFSDTHGGTREARR